MDHQDRENNSKGGDDAGPGDAAARASAAGAVLPARLSHLAGEPELAASWDLLLTSRQAEAKLVTALITYQNRRERESLAAGLPFHERRAARDAALRDAALILGASEPVTSGILTAARTAHTDMPATWRAFTTGTIDTPRMRTIARTGMTLIRPADLEALDTAAAAAAQRLTSAQLRAWLRRFTARLNPAQYAADCAASRADRWVRVHHDDHAMSYLEARLPTLAAEAISNRLRAAAHGQANPIPVPAGLHHEGGAAGPDGPAAPAAPTVPAVQQQALPLEHPELIPSNWLNDPHGQDPVQNQPPVQVPVQVQDGPEILTASPAAADDTDPAAEPAAYPEAEPETDSEIADTRTLAQREADLFSAWLLDGRVEGATVEAKIAIMVPEATLSGDSQAPAISADRRWAIPAEDARHLAAQGLTTGPTSSDTPGDTPSGQGRALHQWYQVHYRPMEDPAGPPDDDGLGPTADEADILSITYQGRYAPARLRDAITFRDGTCQAPGCTVPVARCDLDHQLPYPAGPTSGDNLWALCRRHHRLKSHGHLDTPEPAAPEPDPPRPAAPEPHPPEPAAPDTIRGEPAPRPQTAPSEPAPPGRRHRPRHRSALERALMHSRPRTSSTSRGAPTLCGPVDLLYPGTVHRRK